MEIDLRLARLTLLLRGLFYFKNTNQIREAEFVYCKS
jgi:hypothetical protein